MKINFMKKGAFAKSLLAASVLSMSIGMTASADSAPGDVVVTLGEDLNVSQKNALLSEMNTSEKDATIYYVSNQEEHQYLGKYMSPAKIGTKALSSSKITIGEDGSGLKVETKNINWVSEDMYKNALMTAGVKDADIYVTAPFSVSGTGALTGLLKAYESSADVTISEEAKDAANQELVQTAELGEKVGNEKATDLINLIKLKMSENAPKNDEELSKLIDEAAKELNINLTDAEKEGLIQLFNKMKDMNIDFSKLGDQLGDAKEKFDKFLSDPETQGWIEKIGDFFKDLIDAIKDLFTSKE